MTLLWMVALWRIHICAEWSCCPATSTHADDPTSLPGKRGNVILAFLNYPSSQLKVFLHGPAEANAENIVLIRLAHCSSSRWCSKAGALTLTVLTATSKPWRGVQALLLQVRSGLLPVSSRSRFGKIVYIVRTQPWGYGDPISTPPCFLYLHSLVNRDNKALSVLNQLLPPALTTDNREIPSQLLPKQGYLGAYNQTGRNQN